MLFGFRSASRCPLAAHSGVVTLDFKSGYADAPNGVGEGDPQQGCLSCSLQEQLLRASASVPGGSKSS